MQEGCEEDVVWMVGAGGMWGCGGDAGVQEGCGGDAGWPEGASELGWGGGGVAGPQRQRKR